MAVIVICMTACGAAVYFWIRCQMMRKNIIQADKQLKEIMEAVEENQILKLAAPDKEMEGFLETINQALRDIRRERVRYVRREKEFQRLVENVSHDLRTPLTAMMGYLKIIDQSGLSPEDAQSLEVVLRRADYLQRLITEFYELSCITGEAQELDKKRLDIGKMLREHLADHCQALFDAHLEVEADIPSLAVWVLGDEEACERIFSNLVQNAQRYGISLLKVSMENLGNFVRVTFSNDVRDFSQEKAEKIFERFYTPDDSRTQGSTGLGLSIAREFAQKMGGSLRAEFSQNGRTQWLSFVLLLPSP